MERVIEEVMNLPSKYETFEEDIIVYLLKIQRLAESGCVPKHHGKEARRRQQKNKTDRIVAQTQNGIHRMVGLNTIEGNRRQHELKEIRKANEPFSRQTSRKMVLCPRMPKTMHVDHFSFFTQLRSNNQATEASPLHQNIPLYMKLFIMIPPLDPNTNASKLLSHVNKEPFMIKVRSSLKIKKILEKVSRHLHLNTDGFRLFLQYLTNEHEFKIFEDLEKCWSDLLDSDALSYSDNEVTIELYLQVREDKEEKSFR